MLINVIYADIYIDIYRDIIQTFMNDVVRLESLSWHTLHKRNHLIDIFIYSMHRQCLMAQCFITIFSRQPAQQDRRWNAEKLSATLDP